MILVLFLMLDSFIGRAQELKQTATYVSGDSVIEFSFSRAKATNTQPAKVYYSFVNFKIIQQAGARANTYLHGNFENRSNTTHKLYAMGEFRYALKHGKWRTWSGDGTLKTIERWKKGRLKNREYFTAQQESTSVTRSGSNKTRRKNREPDSSMNEKEATEKQGRSKRKKSANSLKND
jgi:hypothetical protein